MARAQLLDGLRRWVEGVDTLKALLQEADAAERFLGESQATRRTLADEVGRLEARKAEVDAEVAAYRSGAVAKIEREVAMARLQADQALRTIREDADRERKGQAAERQRLEAILTRLEAELGDAQRAHADGLAALRTERTTLVAQLSVQIADLERQRDTLVGEVAARRKDYADITDRLAALARR